MGKSHIITEQSVWSEKSNSEINYIPIYSIRKFDGVKYTISYFPKEESFTINFPDGIKISDSLEEFENRIFLYKNLDKKGEFLQWLLELKSEQQDLYKKNDVREYKFKIGNVEYRLRVDVFTKTVVLNIGRQVLEFDEDNLYLFHPDIPLTHDGELDSEIRNKLKTLGFDLPPSPYKVMLGIEPINPENND